MIDDGALGEIIAEVIHPQHSVVIGTRSYALPFICVFLILHPSSHCQSLMPDLRRPPLPPAYFQLVLPCSPHLSHERLPHLQLQTSHLIASALATTVRKFLAELLHHDGVLAGVDGRM